MPFIEQEFPHLAERYRNTYADSPYAGEKYRDGLARFFDKLCAKYGVHSSSRRYDDADDEGELPDPALAPELQLALQL
jgi:hypothetical protein